MPLAKKTIFFFKIKSTDRLCSNMCRVVATVTWHVLSLTPYVILECNNLENLPPQGRPDVVMMHGRKGSATAPNLACSGRPAWRAPRGSSEPAVGPRHRRLVPRTTGVVDRPGPFTAAGGCAPAPPRCRYGSSPTGPRRPAPHVARSWRRGARHDRW